MFSVIRKKLIQNYKINFMTIVSIVLVFIAIFTLFFGYVFLCDMDTINFLGLSILFVNLLVIILGIFTFLTYFKKSKNLKEVYVDRDRVFSGAFISNPISSIFTENGKVLVANKSYMNLASKLQVVTSGDVPPSVERLFVPCSKETSAAIFRLHNLDNDIPFSSEIVDAFDFADRHRRYKIQVINLYPQKLWQIIDITFDALGSRNKLIDAPVGLFSISSAGEIIEINSTLKRWLSGPKKTKPQHIDEFIENSRELLDRSDSVGEIIRTHSRLINRKGVSTPSIMVGVWASSENGEKICNVSIHGYYSIGFQKSPGSKSIKDSLLSSDSAEDFSAAPIAILHLEGSQLGKAVVKSENFSFSRMSAGVSGVGKTFDKIFDLEKTDRSFLDFVAYECETDKPFDAVLASPSNLNVSVYIVSESEIKKSFRVYMVDTSARKLLEDQLVQSQKMQAIGQLAAGVAHDFNNLLTAIRLNADELLQRHPIGDPSYPELQNINTTGIRAAALVKKLLAFSRKQTRRTESISVTDILTEMVVTLKQTLGERVKLKIVHGRDLPLVRADRSQIDTVLMNLCVNARDAMEKSNGGIISISSYLLKREVIDNPSVQLALKSIVGDDFVVIEVADTGEGMTEDVKSKIFEPFFTTKEIGKGTGLGLATVYGIIKQSGGHLTVDSSLGKGTTFRIYLPSSEKKMNVDSTKLPLTNKRPADLTGQGSILFVEDEISVRDIASKSLRRKGYKVIEADDGEEALEILKNSKEPFDLMISDVVMPSMDGPTLLREGRDLLGAARIVFVSGYAEDDFSELLSGDTDVSFLPKPFTLAQLAKKVKDEIGESDANT